MGLVTITGTIATDETTVRSMTSSFILDVINFFDTTQPVGTTYEMVATVTDAGSLYMWTMIENTGAQEAVVRVTPSSRDYLSFPLPAYAKMIIPAGWGQVAAGVSTGSVHARALTGTSILRVIALFVA